MTANYPPRRRLLGHLTALGLAPLWTPSLAQVQPPAAEPPLPLEAFTAPPQVTNLCLSPDGQQLAWLLHLDGVTALVSRRVDEARPVQVLRRLPGIAIAWVGWLSDERMLVGTRQTMRRSGIDRLETRLLSVRHDGQDVRLLTPPASQGGSDAQVQDRVIDWLPDEADQVLVERPSDSRRLEPSVCRLDTTSGRFTVIHPAERQVLHWMTDP